MDWSTPHGSNFRRFQLSPGVLETVAELGYEEPTPIQEQTIRLLIEGRDVIAQAQTGTGKTAAFAIPIVECVEPDDRRVQALVLAPTRELAVQVAEATHRLGRSKGADACCRSTAASRSTGSCTPSRAACRW